MGNIFEKTISSQEVYKGCIFTVKRDEVELPGGYVTVREVTENMDKFEMGIAVQKVYDFIWEEFCGWYIEMVKPRLYNSDNKVSRDAAMWTLQTVLIGGLKLLHPFMPFIT